MVDGLGDIVTALAEADPADKAEVYRRLGLRPTYQPETKTVRAEVDPGEHRWENSLCPRPDLDPSYPTCPRCARNVRVGPSVGVAGRPADGRPEGP